MDKKKEKTIERVHMKYTRILLLMCGLWPIESTGFKLTLYTAYSYAGLAYLVIGAISSVIEVFVSDEDLIDKLDMMWKVIFSLPLMYKFFITKSEPFIDLIQRLEDKEKEILKDTDDEDIRNIYMEYARACQRLALYNFTIGTLTAFLLSTLPLMTNFIGKSENRFLIFKCWFPFDENEYYWTAYLLQFNIIWIGNSYLVYQGTLYCSLLIFFKGQLHIMRHIFKNITLYMSEFSERTQIPCEESQEYFVNICIKQHQNIIRSISSLNSSIKTYVLIDFFTCSLQSAMLVSMVMMIGGTDVVRSFTMAGCLVTVGLQVILFYWHAHDIIDQSTGISDAVFESDWHELEVSVQKSLLIVMMRSQKSLSLFIGPFYEARVDAIVSIYKAIYSYVALIFR